MQILPCLDALGCSLEERFRTRGDLSDIEEAIPLHRDSSRPASRPVYLPQYSRGFSIDNSSKGELQSTLLRSYVSIVEPLPSTILPGPSTIDSPKPSSEITMHTHSAPRHTRIGPGDFAAAVLLPHAAAISAAVSGSQHVLDVETKSNHNCSGNLAADSGNQTQANILQRQSQHLQRQFGTLQPRLQRQSRSLLRHSHLFAAVINFHTAAIWRQYEHAAANVEHAAALLLVSAAVFFVRGNPHNGTHDYAAAVYVFCCNPPHVFVASLHSVSTNTYLQCSPLLSYIDQPIIVLTICMH
ncbi:hypothetical protein B0H13DRAFT_1913310 [Mycena leptocephala]|nr:hypothetical protein B0H13DRAFT_1913310 [Mycena leptocephala]